MYMLANATNLLPTFHASKLEHFYSNDEQFFPNRHNAELGPVTEGGVEEYLAEDARRWGWGAISRAMDGLWT